MVVVVVVMLVLAVVDMEWWGVALLGRGSAMHGYEWVGKRVVAVPLYCMVAEVLYPVVS